MLSLRVAARMENVTVVKNMNDPQYFFLQKSQSSTHELIDRNHFMIVYFTNW